MKTEKQAQEDAELRQQNLDASVGVDELDPQYGTMATSQQGRSRMQEEATYGEAGEASYDGGGEGEFKARAQPKVGEAMRGIEFETVAFDMSIQLHTQLHSNRNSHCRRPLR